MTTAKWDAAIRDQCLRAMHDYWADLLARVHHEATEEKPVWLDGKSIIDEAMLAVAASSIAMDRGPQVAVDFLGKLIASLMPLIPEKEERRH